MTWQPRSFLLMCCIAAGVVPDARPADATLDLLAATFKIANKDSTATCFVISRANPAEPGQRQLFVVTAAHVFEKMSGNECRIVLRTKRPDGTYRREEMPLKIRSARSPLWSKHPEVDVAALKLAPPAGRKVTALNFERLAPAAAVEQGKLHSAKEVWVPCYPAQLESSSAGFPVLRRGTVASFPLTPMRHFKTYLVDYRTFGGDSGAPVMVRDRAATKKTSDAPLIVGLVIGQHRETTRSVSPIEERTVHRPLGLAIVVHAEFIRQCVDLAAR